MGWSGLQVFAQPVQNLRDESRHLHLCDVELLADLLLGPLLEEAKIDDPSFTLAEAPACWPYRCENFCAPQPFIQTAQHVPEGLTLSILFHCGVQRQGAQTSVTPQCLVDLLKLFTKVCSDLAG